METPSHFGQYGRGAYLRGYPQKAEHTFQDFSNGLILVGANELARQASSPNASDVEVDDRGRLVRSPGTTLLENFDPRAPTEMAVHASLDFTAELILFDPPYLGVKGAGNTTWADLSLHTGPRAWTNFGSTLIFTDGNRVWARQANDGTSIVEVAEAPVARSYASWAGRVWGGMPVIDGTFEPHGLAWSAASSDYRDWTGLGAGNELLINTLATGDQIQVLKPMGLDYMAIFLRSSIWIATRTGQLDRPGDFRVREPGTGAVNRRVCSTSRFGVIYLSDEGVHIFDGNASTHVSKAIDAELLPLDYSNLDGYRSVYDPMSEQYLLHDPAGVTWVFEIEHNRWSRRTLSVVDSAVWYEQIAPTLWSDMTGTWAEQTGTWQDYKQSSDQVRVVFLGERLGETTLEESDEASFQYFGEDVEPFWEMPSIPEAEFDRLVLINQLNARYMGGGSMELHTLNDHGQYELYSASDFEGTIKSVVRSLKKNKIGLPSGIRVEWGLTSKVKLSSLQVLYRAKGQRVSTPETDLQEQIESENASALTSHVIGTAEYISRAQRFVTSASPGKLLKVTARMQQVDLDNRSVGSVRAEIWTRDGGGEPDTLVAYSRSLDVSDWGDDAYLEREFLFKGSQSVQLDIAGDYMLVFNGSGVEGGAGIAVNAGTWATNPSWDHLQLTPGGWAVSVDELTHEVITGIWDI